VVGGTDEVERGDSNDAFAADDGAPEAAAAGGPPRCAAAPPLGSGVMMLTAGVEAALGKSALVGRPVGTDGESAATGADGGGAFHCAA